MHRPSFAKKVVKYTQQWLLTVLIQISAFCGTYGLFVAGYLILHFTIGERWFLISILNNVGHLLTMFCIPALLFTLIVKQYCFPWSVYLLPGALAFLIWYGGEFLPNFPPQPNPDAIELAVMTYNIAGVSKTLAKVTEGTFDVDIAGLQELPGRYKWWSFFFQNNGVGIYSKSPFVFDKPELIFRPDNSGVVAAVRGEIDVEGRIISAYSLHAFRPTLTLRPFEYTSKPRYDDIQALVDAVAVDPNPVIVFCDCNLSDRTDAYQLMTTELIDAWKQRGVGMGLTANGPAGKGWFPFLLLRTDYIWHTEEFETLSIDVLPFEYSDHYPVTAHLRLMPTTE